MLPAVPANKLTVTYRGRAGVARRLARFFSVKAKAMVAGFAVRHQLRRPPAAMYRTFEVLETEMARLKVGLSTASPIATALDSTTLHPF
jgi:hypothetical protein